MSFTVYTGKHSFFWYEIFVVNSDIEKGASDTTISATSTFFYLMVIHPEIQAKAQVEIDRVVGLDRLPSFEDRQSLPYIDAIYREVLRWKPPDPMGIAHRAEKDDTYKGYLIPEGSPRCPLIFCSCY